MAPLILGSCAFQDGALRLGEKTFDNMLELSHPVLMLSASEGLDCAFTGHTGLCKLGLLDVYRYKNMAGHFACYS
ncbi:hypothetical protein N7490_006526 [Penicillium lividum]|nr:hypothetical protein N7490_006526 [Penicillium lividum]